MHCSATRGALRTWAIPRRSSSMGAPRISAFLWRPERAAGARHAWLQAKAASDERRLLLTGTKGICDGRLLSRLRTGDDDGLNNALSLKDLSEASNVILQVNSACQRDDQS